MTKDQITEVQRRAKQDAQAARAGWPVRGNPFQSDDEVALYEECFKAALKEGKK
jgi:hypothetical protein